MRPQRITQYDLDRAHWATGYRLPRQMPEDLQELPDLLDDLPGKAIATVYGEIDDLNGRVPPRTYATPWARETVYFYGDDGRWRVLHLEDLGLPAAGWQGSDSYGAGALSPDGRWWATKSLRGSVVLDLATGELHRGPASQTAVGYQWTGDSQRVHITNQGIGPGQWAAAPRFGKPRPASGTIYPYAGGYAQFDPQRATPPLTYGFYNNNDRLVRTAVVGEGVLGPPFVYRDAGESSVEYGYLRAVSSDGKSAGFLSSAAMSGKEYSTELTVVAIESGSVTSRAQFSARLISGVDFFEGDHWMLDPGVGDLGYEAFPGVRYVWDARTGSVRKLIDLTLDDSEYRIYDLSYARNLLVGRRP
ncbi:hypothetical protein GUY44_21490 [Pimelobacter simplex]|uniref:Uncharacterized protein n=1 Tax=Nocardioides simplex TaxID=2045 RepID=A0A0J9YH43_NOCSI|nr:hypothetical protein [Pimelobacter simplex]AIY16297.1 hypothetical protein KR76_05165 [Pimelobacter simplex]MCG8153071.1 hypothetical protein [Pimelobacter simplex]SFN04781.1 hypothetical protein SAMN05421671_4897 [Pimelobacter simplex]